MAFSAGFRWTVRLIIWAVAAVVMVPMYKIGSGFGSLAVFQQCLEARKIKPFERDNLFDAQQFALCVFLKSNYIESRRMEPVLRDVMSMQVASCDHTGIWKSARRKSVYRVILGDDSRFSAEPQADFNATRGNQDLTGYWGETGGKMVWIYDQGVVWPPDINRIESQSTDRFTLVEVNGERTEYTRERPLQTGRCAAT